MAARTAFGRELLAGKWAAAEFAALSTLWTAGAPVPYPVQLIGSELMMEFVGDGSGAAAPRLAAATPPAGTPARDVLHRPVGRPRRDPRAGGRARLHPRRPLPLQRAGRRPPLRADRPAADRRRHRQPAGRGVPGPGRRGHRRLLRPQGGTRRRRRTADQPAGRRRALALYAAPAALVPDQRLAPRLPTALERRHPSAPPTVGNVRHFDLAIIGTGSANSIPGPDFDHWSIAILEKGLFGGTCTNVGCIPTKMFVWPAELATGDRGGVARSGWTPAWTRCTGRPSATGSSAASTPSRPAAASTAAGRGPPTRPSTPAPPGSWTPTPSTPAPARRSPPTGSSSAPAAGR